MEECLRIPWVAHVLMFLVHWPDHLGHPYLKRTYLLQFGSVSTMVVKFATVERPVTKVGLVGEWILGFGPFVPLRRFFAVLFVSKLSVPIVLIICGLIIATSSRVLLMETVSPRIIVFPRCSFIAFRFVSPFELFGWGERINS